MILLTVSLALFMEAMDTTVINTAIPSMARSLSVNPIDLKIALISYLLSLAIFIPISGWVADKWGIRRIFTGAILIFILSSFWCGFSNNLFELVIARSLQGFGGALALPVGRLILLRHFQRSEMITAMSRVAIIASLGTMLGPVLGGFITYYFSWRWIFWINIPVGLLCITLTHYWIERDTPKKIYPLDKVGFVLFGGSLAGFTFALSAFSESTLSDSTAFYTLFYSLLLFICYFWHSHNRKHPVINSELLHIRTFRISVLGNLFCRLGFGGVPFLLPLLLQISLHYPVQISGILLAPIALGIMFIRPLTLGILRFIGYKKLLIGNTVLLSLSIYSFYFVNEYSSYYHVAALTFLFGILISLQYSGMNSLGYTGVGMDDLSAATSIISTLQQLAQSFGVAISALFLRYFSMGHLGFALPEAAFHRTFLAMGIITLLSAFIFIRLKPDDGGDMIRVH